MNKQLNEQSSNKLSAIKRAQFRIIAAFTNEIGRTVKWALIMKMPGPSEYLIVVARLHRVIQLCAISLKLAAQQRESLFYYD